MIIPDTKASELQQREEIDKLKANDEHALRRLYAANYPVVEKYVLKNSGTREDAKDVYHEAFIATWRNIVLGKFVLLPDRSVNNYLLRVAKNKWMDVLRSQKRMAAPVEVATEELADELPESLSPDEEGYLELVKKHFVAMGDPCKELLSMFYFEKKRLKDIAVFFSWTEATAKNNKYRCLQKLRTAVLNNK